MDVPHARCSTLWFKAAMASSDQSPVPHCKYAVALFRFSPDDQSALEERFRGGFVCPSSSPRGIRRLGGRAKGCSFHFFLDAHHGRLYPLCRASEQKDGRQRTEDGEKWTGILRFPSSVFRYLAVLIFFALGLMAKPMLVTLPFVLLLLDYWPLQRFEPKPR